ncbi:MAG: hypothetical protein CVU28_05395 [Betaproteobacteria bacterium HGW-Betaproteobacteria-21]|nr:MAG: hypothetical protein CVU28_05395 [Betaproteobacteria bacterium HGW-Betaproteobacteria-21]
MYMRLPPALHRPAAICIVLLILGIGSLWLSVRAIEDARTTLIATQAARQQAAEVLQRTQQETDEIRRANARLGALRLSNPNERTPGWEGLRTRLQHDARVLSFDLHARLVATPGATEITDADALPTIRVHHLTLRLDLLHEDGLTAALQVFSAADDATVIPLGCAIERLESINPALRARCELDWLTLHAAAGSRS